MTGFDFEFGPATQAQSKLRMALHGASGSGKTYSSLAIGTNLGENVFLLDTEFGSSNKYAKKFKFQALKNPLPDFSPDKLISFLDTMPAKGFDVLIIDSLTHFWKGRRGFLDMVEDENKKSAAKGKRVDSFGAWRFVTPVWERLVYAIHACRAHVIIDLRAKEDYERDDGGKVRKLGLAPEIRDGFMFEVDVEGSLTMDHDLIIGKTRCDELDGKIFRKPGADVADILKDWLGDGEAYQPIPLKEPSPIEHAKSIGETYVSRFAECKTRSEIDALAQEVAKNKDQLNGDRDRVAKARNDAIERVKSEAGNSTAA